MSNLLSFFEKIFGAQVGVRNVKYAKRVKLARSQYFKYYHPNESRRTNKKTNTPKRNMQRWEKHKKRNETPKDNKQYYRY